MIRAKDVNKDTGKLGEILKDKNATQQDLLRGILKGITLLIKLLRDVKTNQVTIMIHQGIELKKEDQETNEEETKQ